MTNPVHLYERVINKNTKGITELESRLSELSIAMLKEDQP